MWKHNFDINVITETWLSTSKTFADPAKHNHFYSEHSNYQGVLIITKANHYYLPYKQHLWTKHFVAITNTKITVLGVYFQPGAHQEVKAKLITFIEEAMKTTKNLVIAGDFNDPDKKFVDKICNKYMLFHDNPKHQRDLNTRI